MFAWDALTNADHAKLRNLAGLVLTGFLFGLMMIFEWRVLTSRIALIFIPLTIGLVAIGIANRRARKRVGSD